MSKYKFVPWQQPVLTGDADYGIVTASSDGPGGHPYFASDGRHEGTGTSWEAVVNVAPATWSWQFPVLLCIRELVLYNKFSNSANVTKDVSVYADSACTRLIASGTFAEEAFSVLRFSFEEPVITSNLTIVCENGWTAKSFYIGLGEVEITADEAIPVYLVRFIDWDGSILFATEAEVGTSITSPTPPSRKGYTFRGWSITPSVVSADMDIYATYERTDKEASILTTLTALLRELSIPCETAVYSGKAPDTFAVLTPLIDSYDNYADNRPGIEIQEVRISLFTKGNYLALKNKISHALLEADITVTEKRYVAHEDDTGYHHYAIDVAQYYDLEE